jgi:hypothetical protein
MGKVVRLVAVMILARIVTSVCGLSAAVAQNAQPNETADKAVKYCINVVHNTRPSDQYMETFYKNFDAFYNPATGSVQNNAQSVGDHKALFVFEKCMKEQGFPLR